MRFVRGVVLLAPVCLMGQAVSVNLSPPIQESGRAIALIQLFSQPKAEPAALQWTLNGAAAKSLQIEPGVQALAAKKQITCAVRKKDQMTCVIWGPNRNLIHNGIVAKVIAPGTGFQAHLSQISAASADGSSLAVQVPPGFGDTSEAKSFLPGFSAILAGAFLLAVLLAIYLVRRLGTGRPVSKRTPVSRRSGSLH